MPSSYTTNNGLELMATGENSGTWGTKTNASLDIVDRLTTGVGAISLSGTTHTLTTTDATLSDGHYRVLVFGGSPSSTNTVTISPNDQQKYYIVKNNSGESVVLTQGSGGNVTIADGKSAIVYADGAGAGAAVVDVTATFDFQAASAALSAIAALATTDGNFIVGDGSTWVAESGSTVRTSLGLGSIATQAANNVSITGGSITGITDLAVSDGGTGASSFTANNVLLGNGTSAFQVVAPGTSGNVLTSNGTTWTSATPTPGYTDSDVDTHLNTATASSGEVLSWTGSDYDWIAVSAGATDIDGLSDGYSDGSSVGLGSGALANDDGSANENTSLGVNAANATSTTIRSVFVGADSGLYANASYTTAIGYAALGGTLFNNLSGQHNTAIGYGVGQSMTTGANNVLVGSQAGIFLSTGSNNVGLGYGAIQGTFSGTTGSNNVAVGYQTGLDLTTGAGNFLGGYQAGTNLTTGSNNVALGNGALDAATTGGRNIAIGQDAMGLGVATAASGDNVAIGYQAGYDLTSGTDNVMIGELAGANITTGQFNVAIGTGALDAATTGGRNIAIGQDAMGSGVATDATGDNIAIGYQAGFAVTSGTDNIFIGETAGDATTTGANQIVIGKGADASSATVSNEITLGNSSITRFRIPGLQSGASDGDVLTYDATNGIMSLQAPAGGGDVIKLFHTDISTSVASVDITLPSGYAYFTIGVANLKVSADAAVSLRVSTDGGSTFLATSGDYVNQYITVDGTSISALRSTTGVRIWFGPPWTTESSTGSGLSADMTLFQNGSGNNMTVVSHGATTSTAAGNPFSAGSNFGQVIGTTSVVNAVQIIPTAGNFVSGTITLYGHKS